MTDAAAHIAIDPSVVQWAVDGQPASAASALEALRTRPLLVMMHGYGSHEGDLIGLSWRLPKNLVCASPRAPLSLAPQMVGGYSWWPITIGPNGMPAAPETPASFVGTPAHAASLAVISWLDDLDRQLRESGLGEGLANVSLMGFSQGGALVTSLLRLQPARFICGVNCSGFLAPGPYEGDSELAQIRPPMFWGRDEADPVIDRARIQALAEWVPIHTTPDIRLYDGVGHGISLEEIRNISSFLQQHIPQLTGE